MLAGDFWAGSMSPAGRPRAANCSEQCGSLAYLEPVLVERQGACQLLRPHSR
jgi:hypothetical protein